jgi:hypothetical protein
MSIWDLSRYALTEKALERELMNLMRPPLLRRLTK